METTHKNFYREQAIEATIAAKIARGSTLEPGAKITVEWLPMGGRHQSETVIVTAELIALVRDKWQHAIKLATGSCSWAYRDIDERCVMIRYQHLVDIRREEGWSKENLGVLVDADLPQGDDEA